MTDDENTKLLKNIDSNLTKLLGHFKQAYPVADTAFTDPSKPRRLTEPSDAQWQAYSDLVAESDGIPAEFKASVWAKIVGNKPEDLAQPNHQ